VFPLFVQLRKKFLWVLGADLLHTECETAVTDYAPTGTHGINQTLEIFDICLVVWAFWAIARNHFGCGHQFAAQIYRDLLGRTESMLKQTVVSLEARTYTYYDISWSGVRFLFL